MVTEANKKKLVYTTCRKNNKRKRVDDSSSDEDSSIHSLTEDEQDQDQEDKRDGLEIPLKQSVNTEELEITKKRQRLLDNAEIKPIGIQKFPTKISSNQIIHHTSLQYNLPRILYASELLEKAIPFLPIVRDMYEGVISSHYKFEANRMRMSSRRSILSTQEFRSMDLTKFIAGYYGMKRQFKIGEVILQRYRSFLLNRQGDTMRWWGISDFAHYVLAPEVLASLCIQEMRLGDNVYDSNTREIAYDIFAHTIKYGTLVADKSPLEPWEGNEEEKEVT